ncbi:amidohydrolase family protein [Brachybacterium fresconis]|uniref:TIM-barrel fold metal-dependent hydrolase n=1 Tax=Brachybacterium fresconis TaxID=173363 RepID=A0ABS4YNE3_9MICO|nr:amidohydrolase family protein [Brachybacterium fresconis]MBP2410319.1 putative TIM-barrel fold metal-dependent hydrolase [Brachybacterium fresconis]
MATRQHHQAETTRGPERHAAGPTTDEQVADWVRALGVPGFIDLHVHFMPDSVQQKVWDYFDALPEHGEHAWPITYRGSEQARLDRLRHLGVTAFTTLNYAHRPGMADWLNEYSARMAAAHPDVIPSGTFHAEPDAGAVVARALAHGAEVFKVHLAVGGFDPLGPELTPAWEQLVETRTPTVIHCGSGPHGGAHTGPAPIRALLARHPDLVLVIAHAGLPEYQQFADLALEHPGVHLDTTMVATDYMNALFPMPPDYPRTLARLDGKVVLGTDFPSIPYSYAHQLQALAGLGLGANWLADALWHTPNRLLRRNAMEGPVPAEGSTGGTGEVSTRRPAP